MKKKIDKKIIIIVILLVLLIGIIIVYALSDTDSSSQYEQSLGGSFSKTTETTDEGTETVTISKTGEIAAVLEENLDLHATYYFEEMYVEENEYVEEGEKLVKYTNGKYLLAPYDCVITEINVPEAEEQCTNSHYITVKATNVVSMSVSIDETQIDSIKIGQEATLSVTTLNKTYTGYVTKISSTASNGTFTATVEFENDGDIKIGMTGKCTITVI